MTRLARGFLLAASLLTLASVPVFAHADLEETDPSEGEAITTPYTLTATFNEELHPERSSIVVVTTAGEEVARGGISPADPATLLVELPALAPGGYQANWTAVTPDDQAVERGTITFTVVTSQPTATPVRTPATTPANTPAPTPPGPAPQPAATGDIVLPVAIAVVVALALGAYLFSRSRR